MNNLFKALMPNHPIDIPAIRGTIEGSLPVSLRFSNKEIEIIWDSFSDVYCANWLIVSESTLRDFKNWLEE